jgi:hypothetical protein
MKTIKFKSSLIITMAILFTGARVYAIEDKISKEIHEEFQVTSATSLQIENKYGDVVIKDWDQDKLVFDIQITVEHPDDEETREMLSYINVFINKEGDQVTAQTVIDEKIYKTGSWFNISGEDKKFSIDYIVSMPGHLTLDLQNKYGSIIIDELSGKVNIEVKYGDLRANKLTRGDKDPMNEMSLAYAKAKIEESNWIKINSKYSRVDMNKATAVVLMTKYSKIYIDKGSSLVAESKYDVYELGELDNFVVSGKYGDFEINTLSKKINLDVKYSDVKVEFIPAGFESIKVDNGYGSIKLGIDDNASYSLMGNAKYAKIRFPESNNISIIDDNSDFSVSGTIGPGENPASKIIVETKYGNVNLKQ